ncbi:MAG: ABC transporter permease [Aestuariivita sp.]|nr:ABC transporter permease [Aestuariivita sp.]
MTWMIILLLVWITGGLLNLWLARPLWHKKRIVHLIIPIIFGTMVMISWELLVKEFNVSPVILPAPTTIAQTFIESTDILIADFTQTVLKGALSGFFIGAIVAIGTAVIVDRWLFLQRGLLPIGNFVAALPIVGIAPILVNWFGFDWQSKAAVVVVMVFFPILVNSFQGLRATNSIQRDLMFTYAAGYLQTLLKLRLPAAMPFIFNGLKIATTLALIGAIVSEYFGSPTRGMGFRISTGVGALTIDLVWAEIVVAAFSGSVFFGIMVLIERKVTFWHPSQRQ